MTIYMSVPFNKVDAEVTLRGDDKNFYVDMLCNGVTNTITVERRIPDDAVRQYYVEDSGSKTAKNGDKYISFCLLDDFVEDDGVPYGVDCSIVISGNSIKSQHIGFWSNNEASPYLIFDEETQDWKVINPGNNNPYNPIVNKPAAPKMELDWPMITLDTVKLILQKNSNEEIIMGLSEHTIKGMYSICYTGVQEYPNSALTMLNSMRRHFEN